MELLIGSVWGNLVVLVTLLYALANLWYWHKFSYWSSRGVFGPKPKFIIGNLKNVLTRKSQFFGFYVENYFKFKHLPYVGLYSFHKPVLVINDLDLAKNVLIKDFNHFEARGIFSGGDGDPLAGHLFNIHGEKWKKLRAKMTPTFSSAKLKTMFPLVENVAKECINYVKEESDKDNPVNFSELYAKYAIDVIVSIGFGLESNSFKEPNNEFRLKGREYFEPKTIYRAIVRAFAFFAPDVFTKLKINRINPAIIKFFYDLVDNTVQLREKNNFYRNDFLQTLIQLKSNQVSDENGKITTFTDDMKLTMTDVAANTMLYLLAGYETTATTSNFVAYELATNPEIQERARQEVRNVLAQHGGVCTYDALNDMTYLRMVFDETMRKHPPLQSLFRKCTKDYKVPGTDLVIEKGTLVFLPIQGYQMDPDIYSEPEKFDPDRFLPENRAKFHPCQWMPFGEGPRMCIGLRQGYVQSKLALVSLLANYQLEMDESTMLPMQYNTKSLVAAVEGGVWLKVKPLQSQPINSHR